MRILSTFVLILLTVYSFQATAAVDCTITKSNGAGYATTISSVTKSGAQYSIVALITYDGVTEGNALSHFSVQATSGSFSGLGFKVNSGNMTGTLNLGPTLSGDPFTSGFTIENISSIGNLLAGTFQITYTLTSLQDQQMNAKVGDVDYIVVFTAADFQSVYNCAITCATPTITPSSGTFPTAQTITMTSATDGAAIRYTTDGTTPTSGSALYSAPFLLSYTKTIKAIAIKTNLSNSTVATETVTIAPILPTPTFTPIPGTYTSVQNVIIYPGLGTAGATIHYTLDGTPPDLTSPIYSTPIPVAANTTINAYTVKSGNSNSAVATGNYVINLPVASPTFTPSTGSYSTTQNVAISSATVDASIYYTTDGTVPDVNSKRYSAPININANTTIKAFAVKSGMGNSAVTSADFIIKCAPPTFTPVAATYNSYQTVTINCTTPGASIQYTTDNSDPSPGNGALYTTPIAVNASTVIKAYAFKTGSPNSTIVTGYFTISLLKVAAPVISPLKGTYNTYQTITITSDTEGATIMYNTDSLLAPTPTNGTVYTGPFLLKKPANIKTMAFKAGMLNSNSVNGTYMIVLLNANAPTFTSPAGTYVSAQSVTIGSTTPDATIRYTTDGVTIPTETIGTLYTGPITISEKTTLKAIVYKYEMLNSLVTTGTYSFKCATPRFSVAAGSYNSSQSVSLSCETSGATIRYTTDGSQPGQYYGNIYTTAIPINASTTIKAIAYKTGLGNSDIGASDYLILVPTSAPQFSPLPGTFKNIQNVTITSAVQGVSIYYTTDGTDPTTSGTLYSGPVTVAATTTLKAIAAENRFGQ